MKPSLESIFKNKLKMMIDNFFVFVLTRFYFFKNNEKLKKISFIGKNE